MKNQSLSNSFFKLLFFLFFPFASLQATNYINNGSFAAYSLNSGDTLRIAQGTFNGVITGLGSGAVIIIAQGANFTPTVINLWAPAGKIINNGTANFGSMGIGGGFAFDNYGTATVQGDMSFYSGTLKTLTNNTGSHLTINGSLSLSDNTTIINNGTITTTGAINLYVSTASLTNKGLINVGSSFNSQGQLDNQNIINITTDLNLWGGHISNTGALNPKGSFSISAGMTYTNSCRMITKGGINNNGTLINNGLIWAGTTNTSADQFTNSGSFINANNAKLRTNTFINYATITGSGYIYALGQTTLGSGATIGVTGITR